MGGNPFEGGWQATNAQNKIYLSVWLLGPTYTQELLFGCQDEKLEEPPL